jgi:hypothetical protein
MLRFFAGVISTLLLVSAGFFIWKSRAEQEVQIPAAPQPAVYSTPSPLLRPRKLPEPPAADPKSKEEKRFARADKDDDGKITQAELLEPRRKAFAKLDVNGNGSLSFEEWAVKTLQKFDGADGDDTGWLTAAEYATTKPKTKPKPRCAC